MKYLLLLLLSFSAYAEPVVNELYVEAEKTAIRPNRTFNQVNGESVGGWVRLGLQVDQGPIYSKSIISSEYSNTQFRHVSLETELGVRITATYQIYVRHYSGHMLDASYNRNYPEENSIGLRINLIGE